MVCAELEQGLQIAELERGRVPTEDLRGLAELLRRLQLSVRVDDLGPALTFGLGLTRHGPLHGLGNLNVLDFDNLDLHPPGFGLGVDAAGEVLVQVGPVSQERVQVGAADHGAQRGLRHLRGGDGVVLDRHHRPDRVGDLEQHHSVDPGRHVVLGDDVLRRDRQRHDPQVHPHHLVDSREDHLHTGFEHGPQAAEAESDPAFVLLQDLEGCEQPDGHEDHEDDQHDQPGRHGLARRVQPSAGEVPPGSASFSSSAHRAENEERTVFPFVVPGSESASGVGRELA